MFQLAHSKFIHPNYAILLNITNDHLDWHGSMQDYIKSIYNCPSNESYYNYIISLPLDKGLKIEACRFLLNNMDHFRMVIIS